MVVHGGATSGVGKECSSGECCCWGEHVRWWECELLTQQVGDVCPAWINSGVVRSCEQQLSMQC